MIIRVEGRVFDHGVVISWRYKRVGRRNKLLEGVNDDGGGEGCWVYEEVVIRLGGGLGLVC